jgi:hypothetical protein
MVCLVPLTRVAGVVLAIAGAALVLGVQPSRAQSAAPAYTPGEESPEEFPPAPGREEAFYACVACHNFKLVAAQGMSRSRWDDTLTFMTQRHGMPAIEGEDRRLILDYLAAVFPERPAQGRRWQNPFTPR